MLSIRTLKNIGVGKSLLIIGGGKSAGEFNYSKLSDDTVTMSINESYIKTGIEPDYIIYNDTSFIRILKQLTLTEKTKVICYDGSHYITAHYYYRDTDILKCQENFNTGVKALVIAKEIMNFDDIYLIGIDCLTYLNENGRAVSHHYGDEVGHDKKYIDHTMLETHMKKMGEWAGQFEIAREYKNVWNSSKISKLKLFPFAIPY